MVKYDYYINDNGRVRQGSREFPSIPEFKDAMEDIFLGTGEALSRYLCLPAKKMNKSSCSGCFPPNSKYIDPDTKVLNIEIGAIGITENQYSVDIDGSQLIVRFDREPASKEKIYDYKGLKLITDEELTFSFDPRFHDPSTAECKLENGLLTISIQPREEVKPVKRRVGGSLAEKSLEEPEVDEDKLRPSNEDDNE